MGAPGKSSQQGERDERLDMIRGLVMVSLVVVHIEIFSLYNFIVWERIGVVSGAEGFVLLSGLVIGMVYKRRIVENGWPESAWRLLERALLLWRTNVCVIFLIGLLSQLPRIHLDEVMQFNDRAYGKVYSLFPSPGTPLHVWIAMALSLRIGPHQLQILGLYTCLLALTPISLYLLSVGRTKLLLGISWVLYLWNWAYPTMPTGAQFEYAFPLLTWQVLFIHGQALGHHRDSVWAFMKSRAAILVWVTAWILFLAFAFWAQNTPNPVIPAYSRLSLVPPERYHRFYDAYMMKNTLGPLRLLDDAAVFMIVYWLLSKFSTPAKRLLGWFLIPFGQASLYVFIVHIFFVALAGAIVSFGFPLPEQHLLRNTLVHTVTLLTLWTMVKRRWLFRWIPR